MEALDLDPLSFVDRSDELDQMKQAHDLQSTTDTELSSPRSNEAAPVYNNDANEFEFGAPVVKNDANEFEFGAPVVKNNANEFGAQVVNNDANEFEAPVCNNDTNEFGAPVVKNDANEFGAQVVNNDANEFEFGAPVYNNDANEFAAPVYNNGANEFARSREVDLYYYYTLHYAAKEGDWKLAKMFFQRNPAAVTAIVSLHGMTALHVAAASGRWQFVEKLIEHIPGEAAFAALAKQDDRGCTALHYLAICGTVSAAEKMISKNCYLPYIMDRNGRTPLYYAAVFGPISKNKKMVWFLCTVTQDEDPSNVFTGRWAPDLIFSITGAGHYVVPSHLHYMQAFLRQGEKEDPYEKVRDGGPSLMNPMKGVTRVLQWFDRLIWSAFEQMTREIKQMYEHICDAKLKHKYSLELLELVCKKALEMNNAQFFEFMGSCLLHRATMSGVVEIVEVCLKYFPDMIQHDDNRGYSLIHVAIEHRQEKIFNFLCDLTAINMLAAAKIVLSGDNILHLAAKLPPAHQLTCVPGSALQVQRELQWFKEVGKLVNHSYKISENFYGKTAQEIFTEEHKDLFQKGERWMKDTSTSCMVVSTLISTVVFAAAFTVPGGNNSDLGSPIFLHRNSFMVFAVSDALALFSSTTSLLIFLSILTSSYAEEDFLEKLPKRLITGLASLFFAMATMMVAFAAALSIVLDQRIKWIFVPMTILGCVPVTLFVMLQLPLFIQMVQSTYGNGIFRKESRFPLNSSG